ncbi:MAG: 50S ribosomal protein L23 [bacterium]|nr:50S ribosomal protein L23 [bacterium]
MAIIETKKEDKKSEKSISAKIEAVKSDFAYRFLIEPWITEKSHQEMAQNKYIFRVDSKASKNNVKKAVEDQYKVKVINVNTVNIHPKKRIYGKSKGFKSGYKKAIVTLKKGDKIELFEGV